MACCRTWPPPPPSARYHWLLVSQWYAVSTLSNAFLPNSRPSFCVGHRYYGNTSLPLDEKNTIRKSPRDGTPHNASVDHREKLGITLDRRHHGIHTLEELRAQAAEPIFVPPVHLGHVGFRFRSYDQWLFHDLDRLRIRR